MQPGDLSTPLRSLVVAQSKLLSSPGLLPASFPERPRRKPFTFLALTSSSSKLYRCALLLFPIPCPSHTHPPLSEFLPHPTVQISYGRPVCLSPYLSTHLSFSLPTSNPLFFRCITQPGGSTPLQKPPLPPSRSQRRWHPPQRALPPSRASLWKHATQSQRFRCTGLCANTRLPLCSLPNRYVYRVCV